MKTSCRAIENPVDEITCDSRHHVVLRTQVEQDKDQEGQHASLRQVVVIAQPNAHFLESGSVGEMRSLYNPFPDFPGSVFFFTR